MEAGVLGSCDVTPESVSLENGKYGANVFPVARSMSGGDEAGAKYSSPWMMSEKLEEGVVRR